MGRGDEYSARSRCVSFWLFGAVIALREQWGLGPRQLCGPLKAERWTRAPVGFAVGAEAEQDLHVRCPMLVECRCELKPTDTCVLDGEVREGLTGGDLCAL